MGLIWKHVQQEHQLVLHLCNQSFLNIKTLIFPPNLNLSSMCARGLRRDEGAASVRITHPHCEHTGCLSERPALTLTECANNPCLCATNCSGVCVLCYTWLSPLACSNVGICLHFHLPTEWLLCLSRCTFDYAAWREAIYLRIQEEDEQFGLPALQSICSCLIGCRTCRLTKNPQRACGIWLPTQQ